VKARWMALGLISGFGLIACASSSTNVSTPPTSAQDVSPPAPTTGALPWLAPPDPMARARAAGLVPETAERLSYHVHAHLDVFLDGVVQAVPAGIGINTADPAVHRFTTDGQSSYGGIAIPCAQPCISPLHTHDVTGILHTESATQKDNTLGQFFVEWAVRLTATCAGGYCRPTWPVAFYVNGRPTTGDPRSIALSDHKEIAIVIGRPPAQIPVTANWSNI
jgi:hypothetical protein